MNGNRTATQPGAIAILEEAVDLLRSAPLSTMVVYLTGAIPFAVGLLLFASDMNRSPFAFEHLAAGSLAVAVLFVWKSVWQAIFAARLYRQLSPGPGGPLHVPALIARQTAIQSLGLVAIPVAVL